MAQKQANSAMRAALVEVRKAYRLLWLYQQTLMDAYNQIVQHLNVKHYYGALHPLQRSTNPAPRPPAALLPLLYIETLYLHSPGDANAQKPDDYMVDICPIADTGYLSTTNEYPTDTGAASEASSELWVYVFHAREASSLNWYNPIYGRTDDDDDPDHNAARILKAQPTIQVYGYHFDVATLTDQQAIALQMADCTGQVWAGLGLQL